MPDFKKKFEAIQAAFAELNVIAEIDMIADDIETTIEQTGIKSHCTLLFRYSEAVTLRTITTKLKELVS